VQLDLRALPVQPGLEVPPVHQVQLDLQALPVQLGLLVRQVQQVQQVLRVPQAVLEEY
jgi:hypothetical protein